MKKGCIFHADPLKWGSSKTNHVGVIEYVGYDVKKKKYDDVAILNFPIGVKLAGLIGEQLKAVGKDFDDIDTVEWIISKTGSEKATQWSATMLPDVLKDDFSLSEFPDQPNFGDDELPPLVDYDKFDEEKPTTAAGQRKWYDELIAGSEGASDEETPPGPPAGAASATSAKPATANGKPITLPKPAAAAKPPAAAAEQPVKRGPGRPPKPPAAAASPIKPIAKPPAGPTPFELAQKTANPWAGVDGDKRKTFKELDDSEIDFIIDAGATEESGFTQAQVDAATIIKEGPKSKGVTPPEPPADEAADEGEDLGALQARLLSLTKSSESLKNFKNMKLFLQNCADGAAAIQKIDDADLLKSLIELVEGDEDALKEAAGIG